MLILASQSPRRQELLRAAGLPFVVRPSHVPEQREPDEPAEAYVQRLAAAKAGAIAAEPGHVVLGADTVVVVDGHVLEKPASVAEAAHMLRRLRERDHEVLTGVCLRRGDNAVVAVERTVVRFGPVDDAEVEAYANSGEPLDKAGGYGIQGLASRYITGIQGDYGNVVGLPVALVYRLLKQSGFLADALAQSPAAG